MLVNVYAFNCVFADSSNSFISLLFKLRMANFPKTLLLVSLARIQYARDDAGSYFLYKAEQKH